MPTSAPPPKGKKSDQTTGLVLIFVVGLAAASALLWAGFRDLKRSADPYAAMSGRLP
jgi:hypothetical protein